MNWMNWAWIAGGLLGSLAVGMLIGRIVAGIKYPNPDKPHIFTPKQSAIILVSVLAAVAVLYQPKPKANDADLPFDGEMVDSIDSLPEDGTDAAVDVPKA